MRLLIVADKYKDSFSALEVAGAMERGLRRACPDARIDSFPLADGGEGSLDAWLRLENATGEIAEVMDPFLRLVRARYGLSRDGKTAFVEMAQASGLERLLPEERDCWTASTYGTGQLVGLALDRGAERIILSAGGSATVDGGAGMAAALGFLFLDKDKRQLSPTGGQLLQIHSIEKGGIHPRLKEVAFEVWTDVDNPLCGPDGAAFTYSRQKGATAEQIPLLDRGLHHLASVCGFSGDFPGAGAGGGLGYGAVAFLRACVLAGAKQFLSYSSVSEAFDRADWVFTGEGCLDAQTRHGKLIHAVCSRARVRDLPVVAICGRVEATSREIADLGLLAAFSAIRKPGPLLSTLEDVEEVAQQLGRVLSFM